MSQLPQEPRSQQSIEDSSLSKSQVAQASRDVHQTHQEIHYHLGDRSEAEVRQPVRKGVEKILLQQVKSEINERLSTSLHSATFINLAKEKQSTQVQRSWDAEVKIGQQQSIPLEAGTGIIDIFDQTNISGKLLILGAPGSGKTTTLLELSEVLVQRAENHLDTPIPVLLNLASWKNNQPLEQWLIKELKSKYGVRDAIVQTWLNNYQLLPLLDGLDEVDARWHEACIQAINQLYEKCRPEHLVVCCRLSEYENSRIKLQLNGAIYLKPLSQPQIHDYLMSAEHPELWQRIEADPALMKLARSPLLLSILTLARQEVSIEEWRRQGTGQEQRRYLIRAYVDRMLARPIAHHWYPPGEEPTPQQTQRWLSKLARHLEADSQSEFLIERIQPDWLQTPRQNRLYRLSTGLILGLVMGAISGFGYRVYEGLVAYVSEGLWRSLIAGLFSGFASAIFYGLVFGIAGLLIFGLSNRLFKAFIYGPIIGLLAGVSELLEGGQLSDGLSGGLVVGLFFAVIAATNLQQPIRSLETLSWSISKAKSGAQYGFISGAIVAVLIVPTEGLEPRIGLFCILMLGGLVLGSLVGGFQNLFKTVAVDRLALKNMLQGGRYGLIGGLGLGLLWNVFFVFYAVSDSDSFNTILLFEEASFAWNLLIFVIIYELFGGLCGAITGGFIALFKTVAVGRLALKNMLRGGRYGLIGGLALGLLWNVFFVFKAVSDPDSFNTILLFEEASFAWNLLIFVIIYELFGGLCGAIAGGFIAGCFGLCLGMWREARHALTDAKRRRWSLPGARRGLLVGGLGGLILAIMALSKFLDVHPFLRLLVAPLWIGAMGLFGGLIGAAIGGFRGPDIETRTVANQGIWQSAVNASIIALVSCFLIAGLITLFGWLSGEVLQGINSGLSLGFIGLFGGLALGVACIRHVALRFTLYRTGLAPWNFARFLNYASERMLVRRIGGRYQFIHDVFQQYFASL